jgi:hypothetical protein
MGHLSGLSAKGLTLVTPTAKLNVHYLFLVSGVSPIIAEGVAMPDRTEDHRLFFAAELGASAGWRVRRFAQALAGEHQIGGRPIPPERLHVSLALVERRERRRPAVPDGLRSSAELAPKERTAGGGSAGRDDRAGAAARRALRGARTEAGPRLRAARLADLEPDFLPERAIEPFSWTVSEFVLIHSVHGSCHHGSWCAGR